MVMLLLAIIYLAFISLGLPDSLLGAAWPTMYPALGVSVSASGPVYMIVALGTIVSSLLCHRITARFGTALVTAGSAAITAGAMFGFAVTGSYPLLCLWAIPYGLGAGGVDACLNNYVALHYESKHMSWLHCMWGLGASVGPYIMGAVLSGGGSWNRGYVIVGLCQLLMTAALFASLPVWKTGGDTGAAAARKSLSLGQILSIPGAKAIMAVSFCYCAIEQTGALWAASYLVLDRGIHPDTAAGFADMFYLGITLGRFLNGFVAMRLSDDAMIRMGFGIITLGLALMLLPLGQAFVMAGLIILGLGCAPIYPCIIHATPEHFGPENSQALIGIQMASAYVGTCLMPPLFGLLSGRGAMGLLPWYLLGILIVMVAMYRRLKEQTA